MQDLRITGNDYTDTDCEPCTNGFSNEGSDRCSQCATDSFLNPVSNVCEKCPSPGQVLDPIIQKVAEGVCPKKRECSPDEIKKIYGKECRKRADNKLGTSVD